MILPLLVRANLRVMVIKGYSTFPRAPRLEPNHQMQFVIFKILNGITYHYLTLIILVNIIHLFAKKWFQVLLSTTNNSI